MRILLAISGGIDSMYLANMAPELFPGATFAVAHCNFGLRGEESDGDEAFVREWCSSHGMECFVKRFDTARYAHEKGISIEMAARELRYSWFAQLCHPSVPETPGASSCGFDALAVAHNANDNAETLLLNMVRGCGSRGMRGMSEDCTNADGLRILRPMLGISREEIAIWAKDNAIAWREDSTNADTIYKRNRIRHEVLPVLKEMNPSVLRTLRQDMERIAQTDDIAQDYFRLAARECLCEDGVSVNLKKLAGFTHRDWLLFRLTEGRIGDDVLHRLQNYVEKAIAAGNCFTGGKQFGPYVTCRGILKLGSRQHLHLM
ncbi:MAG: tRNA lysidine(34) synthetase TilS [Bacteroidales bacterium]|nr:tRNA lysidine(34) synthetase TilS [Candidatus Cryptobacteroides aphodequi]